jgi:hypothetical protein
MTTGELRALPSPRTRGRTEEAGLRGTAGQVSPRTRVWTVLTEVHDLVLEAVPRAIRRNRVMIFPHVGRCFSFVWCIAPRLRAPESTASRQAETARCGPADAAISLQGRHVAATRAGVRALPARVVVRCHPERPDASGAPCRATWRLLTGECPRRRATNRRAVEPNYDRGLIETVLKPQKKR